jgi:EAL domain-containing protein (putative c-di-GMP-specific phosphodiesterase class I)
MPSHSLDIYAALDDESGRAIGRFRHLTADSAFQPIFSLAHHRPVGYEGLLRAFAPDGSAVSPMEVFGLAEDDRESTYLDRLCRAVHLRNFLPLAEDGGWIFMNIAPRVVVEGRAHGAFFADLLLRHGFPPHRVVVEIVEEAIQDEGQLAEAVLYYKRLGCLVAIDDFGAGYSNFDRIWRLEPHIVKLDRSVGAQAASNPRMRRMLPNLANLIHEAGSLVLMEGIETETEALIAMDADVDFVQGYFFGRPSRDGIHSRDSAALFDDLNGKFRQFAHGESARQRDRLERHLNGFRNALRRLESGEPMASACADFLLDAGAQCCYLLDGEGRQIGSNMDAAPLASTLDPRFLPLMDASVANWGRRQYFRQAIQQPGQVHASNPYLSISTSKMCGTLSAAIQEGGQPRVLCCDLDWS